MPQMPFRESDKERSGVKPPGPRVCDSKVRSLPRGAICRMSIVVASPPTS